MINQYLMIYQFFKDFTTRYSQPRKSTYMSYNIKYHNKKVSFDDILLFSWY